MKNTLLCSAIILLSACGGSPDSDTHVPRFDNGTDSCTIITNEIHLSSGESCELTTAQASRHNLTAGELVCTNGVLRYANSSFNAVDGVSMNDLTFYCELSGR